MRFCACAAVLLASGSATAQSLAVRFAEVGEGGVVYPGMPVEALAEVQSGERFQGSLETELSIVFRRQLSDEVRRHEGGDAVARFALAPGERAWLPLKFPAPLLSAEWSRNWRGSWGQPEVAIDGVLRDALGMKVLAGRAQARWAAGPRSRTLIGRAFNRVSWARRRSARRRSS